MEDRLLAARLPMVPAGRVARPAAPPDRVPPPFVILSRGDGEESQNATAVAAGAWSSRRMPASTRWRGHSRISALTSSETRRRAAHVACGGAQPPLFNRVRVTDVRQSCGPSPRRGHRDPPPPDSAARSKAVARRCGDVAGRREPSPPHATCAARRHCSARGPCPRIPRSGMFRDPAGVEQGSNLDPVAARLTALATG